VVLVLATANVIIRTIDAAGTLTSMPIIEFMEAPNPDSLESMVYDVTIPFSPSGQILDTFKVMQRHANAHALLNAGFSIEVATSGSINTVKSARLVVGNVQQGPLLCNKTAAALVGKPLTFDTLRAALPILTMECIPKASPDTDPNHVVVEAEFSVRVVQNLLYKFWLGALVQCGGGLGAIDTRLTSAVGHAVRPVTGGSQAWPEPPNKEAPIGLPVSKVDGPVQVTGEAQYSSEV
jgi:xanthine dehydrogenase iron-sulfur cluster and FAD-binding subunit A